MIAANKNPEPEETPDDAGGKGELLSDPTYQKADLRTISMALRRGWEVPERTRATVPERIAKIAEDAESDPELVLKAATVLDKMIQTNLRQLTLAAGIDRGVTNNTQINISFDNCDADEKRKRLARVLAFAGHPGPSGKSNGHPGGNGHGPNGHAGEILPS